MVKIGNATLYNGDCMDLTKQYPDKHFDLAIADPPYGINSSKETCITKKHDKTWASRKLVGYKKKDWDKKHPDQSYFNELFRVSKKQIICGGNYFDLPKTGGWIIWDKEVAMPSLSKCELLWTSFLGHTELIKLLWSGYRKCEQLKRIHPTQKPVALYKWLLSKYAKQGYNILDTHLGSGSIAVACNEMGFELTASELDRDYFNAACKRIAEANRHGYLLREAF